MTQPNPAHVAALQDPEYLALLAQLQADLDNQTAEYDAQSTGLRGRYGQLLRAAGQQLPQDLKRSTESAAGRGMLYAGGLLEEQGDIQRRFADYNAQIGEDQTSELNGIERGRLAARNSFNARRESGLQGAIQRAIERAEKKAIADAEKAASEKAAADKAAADKAAADKAATPTTPVAGPPAGAPAATAPAAPATAAPATVPTNAGNVSKPAPVVIPNTQMGPPTPEQIAGAAASNISGRNDPTKPASHTNPILRPGDAPTPNSPLNGPSAGDFAAPTYNHNANNPSQPVSHMNPILRPGDAPTPNSERYNSPAPAPTPPPASVGGYRPVSANPQHTTLSQIQQATNTAPTKPTIQRDMTSFSSKDQTVLALGGTVKLGGVIPAKYNPLTGKVEPI